MKKAFVSLVLLIAFAAAAFIPGWLPFWVPLGEHGVLVSKTGGIDPAPISPGAFRWAWERLIPTNSRILRFKLDDRTRAETVSGTLPSADLYAKLLEGTPDFSYRIDLSLAARVDPVALPSLVKEAKITDQSTLDAWTDAELARVGKSLASTWVSRARGGNPLPTEQGELAASLLAAAQSAADRRLTVTSVSVSGAKLPDLALYALAERAYARYQDAKASRVERVADEEAGRAAADYLELERLAQWGELLTKYPILIDFIAVTRSDPVSSFRVLDAVKKP